MSGHPRRARRTVLAGISTPLDTSLVNFINHHGIEKVSDMITECAEDKTRREAFDKLVSDFNSKHLIVDDGDQDLEDEHQDRDLKDEGEDNDVDEGEEDENEGEDNDVDEGEEDEDEADGKACKLFGGTKRAGLVKRLHAPIGDELEPKKPRIAESSCVHGDKTEAAGIKDSSLQA